MKKPKKIPMRKCVVTNERFPKKELLRIVRTPEGNVIYDKTGKANGRGVYLSKSKTVIKKAKEKNILSRHLNIDVEDEIFNELFKVLENEN
ncbi:MAG: RNase P modulator RnpM [Bacillota bacterium]